MTTVKKKPKKKKPKKIKQSTLKNKCDSLWSQLIRRPQQCQWCHKQGERFEAAHIISRTYSKTRHNLFNGLCLCSACHRKGHQFPTLFTELVIQTIGQDKLSELHTEAQRVDYKVDYSEVLDRLNAQ